MNDLTFAATLLSCFVALVFAAVVEVVAPAGSVSAPAVTCVTTSHVHQAQVNDKECAPLALAQTSGR